MTCVMYSVVLIIYVYYASPGIRIVVCYCVLSVCVCVLFACVVVFSSCFMCYCVVLSGIRIDLFARVLY